MAKRLTPDEMLQEVIRTLALPRWRYTLEPNDWFFASDAVPHSSSFKYMCNKLYTLGFLEREGDGTNRWGYRYRVPINQQEINKENEDGS